MKFLKKNEIYEIEITALSATGSGVGHIDGTAVFVPFSAVGDRLFVLIVKVKKNYAFGKITEIISPSPDRVKNACPVFGRCGGCSFRHISYSAEVSAKALTVRDNIRRIGGIADFETDPPICGKNRADRYRNKAQYPVRLENGELKTGFFSQRSHRVNNCADCLLQPKIFEDIIKTAAEFIKAFKITVYDENLKKGLVRHICVRLAEKTDEIMVIAVVNGSALPHSEVLVEALKNTVGERLKSVVLNINREDTNVVLGKECKTLFGSGFITDEICGIRVRISPRSFYQVNREMAEKLYLKAAEYAKPDGKTVLDLYCGTGTIGLTMAKRAKKIIGVEIVPEAVADAEINAAENGTQNAEFICADAAKAAAKLSKRGEKPDTVILDPPRKGCSEELLKITANEFSPERIVYVSCDSATLARDLKILSELGYSLKKATPCDLFPRTAHVETVVQLVRKKPDTVLDVKIDLSELDVTPAETEATYQEIKDYISEQYGVRVSSLYIAQVKEKHGLKERENYNKPKSEDSKQPQCPAEKKKLIEEALRHFQMMD